MYLQLDSVLKAPSIFFVSHHNFAPAVFCPFLSQFSTVLVETGTVRIASFARTCRYQNLRPLFGVGESWKCITQVYIYMMSVIYHIDVTNEPVAMRTHWKTTGAKLWWETKKNGGALSSASSCNVQPFIEFLLNIWFPQLNSCCHDLRNSDCFLAIFRHIPRLFRISWCMQWCTHTPLF